MKKASLIFWFLFSGLFVSAQILPNAAKTASTNPSPNKDPLNRDSPQSSVVAFLEAARGKNYGRARKYLDLRNVPDDERLADGTQLARQLQTILDRDTQFDVGNLSRNPEGDLSDSLPPNRDRLDTFPVNGQTLEVDLERVTLHSGLSVWVVSSDSLAKIPLIAQQTNNSIIERHLPLPLVNWQLIDTALWRWIGLVLLAFALAALSKLLSRFALWLTQEILKRPAPKWNLSVLETFVGPLRLLLSVSLFRAGMEWFAPSALVRLYLGRVLALLFFLGLFCLCAVVIDAVVRRLRTRFEAKHRAFSHSVLPLAGRIFKIVVLLLAFAAVLSEWGYDTTTLLAGLGIGGVAIALASQKTIENLFGSVSVISDRPVSVGEFCKFGTSMGTVEDIGLRSTSIRTLDRTLVTIPNGSFSTMTLENFDRRDKMLFHVTLNLARTTTPDQMRALLRAITKLLRDTPKIEAGGLPARFIGVGQYSLDIEIFVYVTTLDGDEFMKIQQGLLLAIMDAVESAGTALALPTQASVDYGSSSEPQPTPRVNGSRSPQPVGPRQS